MKIRTKFTLGISLVALVTAVIFSMVVYYELLDQTYDSIDKELNSAAGTIFSRSGFFQSRGKTPIEQPI